MTLGLQYSKRLLGRYPVASFLLLAFLWTWGSDGIVYLVVGTSPGILVIGVVRAWGPLIAAGIVTWGTGGSLREWAGQVTKWRVNPRWYLIAIALPLLWKDGLAVSAGHFLTGGSIELIPAPWWHYLGTVVVVFFFAGGLEEFGWRGFAQPRLQEEYSAFTAAIGIGIAWTLWHLPLFYVFDLSAYDPSTFWSSTLATTVVFSVALAWLYNSTRGSLLFPMLAHTLGNMPAIATPLNDSGVFVEYTFEAIALILLVGLLVVYGPRYLAASKPRPLVPGLARNEQQNKA